MRLSLSLSFVVSPPRCAGCIAFKSLLILILQITPEMRSVVAEAGIKDRDK